MMSETADKAHTFSCTYFKVRLFDAVSSRCGFTGLMLTEPIFWSESSYQRALDLSWRRSRCVTPPEASDAHSSCPAGGRSMLVIRTSPDENTSRDTPVARERLRIVQSYAVVNTCRGQNEIGRRRAGQRALRGSKGWRRGH